MKNRKIIVIAAHPDDEILGCGAAIYKHIKQGDTVRTVILSRGMKARGNTDEAEKSKLEAQCRKANQILGVSDIVLHDFPDNEFDTVSRLTLTKVIENELKSYQPNLIYTHFGEDLNIDHRRIYEAVLTACRPQPESIVPAIYSFFIPSSTDWGCPDQPFIPTVFIDVSDVLEIKLLALQEYSMEMRQAPHSRSIDSVKTMGKYWGNRIGCHAAEPFKLVREIKSKP